MSQVMSEELEDDLRKLHAALERALKHVPDQVHPLYGGKALRMHIGPYTFVVSKRKE